jgi:hypothetical protein
LGKKNKSEGFHTAEESGSVPANEFQSFNEKNNEFDPLE